MSQGLLALSPKKRFHGQSMFRNDSLQSQLSFHSENICADDLLNGSVCESTQGLEMDVLFKQFSQEGLPKKLSQDTFYSPVKRPKSQKLEKLEDLPIMLHPPGLNIFLPRSGFKYFDYGDLNLDIDFNLTLNRRLRNVKGIQIERLKVDPVYLIETLTPTSASSILVKSQEDYRKIMDFLFFSISVFDAARELDRLVLVKGFSDMLINYGYKWTISIEMFITVLLNYRFNVKMLSHKGFFKEHAVLSYWIQRFERNLYPSPSPKNPYHPKILVNMLTFIKELVFRGCFKLETYNEFRLVFWLLFLTSQHTEFIRTGILFNVISDMLTYFMDKFGPLTREQVQELAVLTTANFHPVTISKATRTWTSAHIPNHIRVFGSNHPLNMLYALSTIPRTHRGLELRALMSYLCVQQMLGVAKYRVPDKVLMTELWAVVSNHLDKWEMMKADLTCMKVLIGLLDFVFYSIGTEMTKSSRKARALRNLLGIVEKFKEELQERKNSELDESETIILRRVQEVCRRWKHILRPATSQTSQDPQSLSGEDDLSDVKDPQSLPREDDLSDVKDPQSLPKEDDFPEPITLGASI